MFNFNRDLNKIREINGIRDSLIPFLISYLSQSQNIFYVAKNDLELSNVYNFLYSNFKEINIYKSQHGIVCLMISHHQISI